MFVADIEVELLTDPELIYIIVKQLYDNGHEIMTPTNPFGRLLTYKLDTDTRRLLCETECGSYNESINNLKIIITPIATSMYIDERNSQGFKYRTFLYYLRNDNHMVNCIRSLLSKDWKIEFKLKYGVEV